MTSALNHPDAWAPSFPGPSRVVSGSPGIQVSLSHYGAGERHHRHAHDHVQVSFLIAGGVEERIGRRGYEMTTSAACIKPIGADHEDLWGRNGALMLTVRLERAELLETTRMAAAKWQPCAPPPRSILAAALTVTDKADVDALATDLVAFLDEVPAKRTQTAPPWIRRVVEALWDGEQLTSEEAARLGGVHRVHLSRAFARHVGVPFSTYRRRIAAASAIEATVRTAEPFASIAAAAGFADQAHMNRTINELAGTSPKRLRQAFTRY